MRIALFVLVLFNTGYFAWARWIDTPTEPVASAITKLPELRLAGEAPATSMPVARQEEPARCVSVGPFDDLAGAARAAATLHQRGLETRQRAEQGSALVSYWVYVDGLRSAQEETRVMRRLERGRISDASVMPASDTSGRRISVGLFSDRSGAERRSRAVEKLGIKTHIVEQAQSGAAYWIDFELTARDSAIAAEGLLSTDDRGSRIEIRACPGTVETPDAPLQREADRDVSSPVRVG
jgi:hypothetical protein